METSVSPHIIHRLWNVTRPSNLIPFRNRVTEYVSFCYTFLLLLDILMVSYVLWVVLVYCFVIRKRSLRTTYNIYIPLNDSVYMPELGLVTN
jgi:hypothetical protein